MKVKISDINTANLQMNRETGRWVMDGGITIMGRGAECIKDVDNHKQDFLNKINETEQVLSKQYIAQELADRYNELLELIEDEHFTYSGKQDLQDKGEYIEEIAKDLEVYDEFNKLIKGEIS